jgi:hypothetical protein
MLAALDFACVKVKIFAIAFAALVVAGSIYGNLSVMSQSSAFWESMVLAAIML